MIRTRGIALLATAAFVRENYGPDAHAAILARLPPEAAVAFHDVREGGWKPLWQLGVYIETLCALFAPDDPTLHRRLGAHVGRLERKQGGFEPMLVTPEVSARMAPLVWKALYDAGRMEARIEGERRIVARLSDFPAAPGLCETTLGALEGMCNSDLYRATVEETACQRRGDACCEFTVDFTPAK